MRRKWMFIGPAAILGMLLFAFIGGELVMLLWNWLLPPLFDARPITFWQALGLLALCRILFGGLGGRGCSRSSMRRRIADRMEAMTPEERDRIRQRMRERWGFGSAASENRPE